MNHLTHNRHVVFETPSGLKTSVHRSGWPADKPPLTVQSGIAWHYTSLPALESILRGQELWATNWRATNDTSEFRHGINFLGDAWTALEQAGDLDERTRELLATAGPIDEYVEYFDDVHLLCAARERDSPYQWNSYADGSDGMAVALDLRFPMVSDVDDRPRRRKDAEIFGFQWLKVIYSETQKQMAAARFVRELNRDVRAGQKVTVTTLVAMNVLVALNFKHQGFRHERETRCVTLCAGVDLQHMLQIPEKTIVPWKGSPGYGEAKHRPLPITEVMIGPRTSPETAARVEEALRTAGLPGTTVTSSSLPFR